MIFEKICNGIRKLLPGPGPGGGKEHIKFIIVLYFWLFLGDILLLKSYCSPVDQNLDRNISAFNYNGACPKCSQENFEDIIRLNFIKKEILEKLGFSTTPNISEVIPRQVVYDSLFYATQFETHNDNFNQNRMEEDHQNLTQEFISYAKIGENFKNHKLIEFDSIIALTNVREYNIQKATLYIKITNSYDSNSNISILSSLRIWVFEIFDDYEQKQPMKFILSTSVKSLSWQKLDITNFIKDWYNNLVYNSNIHNNKIRLLIDCTGCGQNYFINFYQDIHQNHYTNYHTNSKTIYNIPKSYYDNHIKNKYYDYAKDNELNIKKIPLPFLLIKASITKNKSKRNKRRALNCSGSQSKGCCKESFYVSFKALGWADWIIAPSGYFANYCRGICNVENLSLLGNDISENYRKKIISNYNMNGIDMCCSPVKVSSMSLIYYSDDGGIIKKDLPRMIVDECGCS